jgi:NAD(P)-dependent dehydrogenase (short-subunit alcohol dehydrogenase family)
MRPKPISELISLKGRRALITGAAAGIGEAIAYRFAEAGADLELADIDEIGLQRVKEMIADFDVEVNTHVVDLSNRSEISKLWEGLNGREPDILVNNAGIYPFKNFLEVDEEFLRKVVSINLDAVFWMCQEMIRRRLEKGGVIINVGSIEAILPFAKDLAHYTISKAGVIALTRSLAKEYGRHGFRVNAIVPGGIMTRGVKDTAKQILRLKIKLVGTAIEFMHRIPLGRMGEPDEVARIALVLASDLSSYVTGAIIPVDGGFLSS